MSEAALTAGQRRVLVAIDEATRARGFAPSLREVGNALGLSGTRIHQYLKILKTLGLVAWQPLAPRTLVITDRGRASLAQWNEVRTA